MGTGRNQKEHQNLPFLGAELSTQMVALSATQRPAIRRYLGHKDDFFFLDTFLNKTAGANATETYKKLSPQWECQVTKDFGCYADPAHRRILPLPLGGGDNFTREFCGALGKNAGLATFGVEYGSQCWCGKDLPAYAQKLNDTDCNMPCAGDSKERCGGPYKANVFQATCALAPTQDSLTWSGWRPEHPPSAALYELTVWPESIGNLTVTTGGYNVTIGISPKPWLRVTGAGPDSKQLASLHVDQRLVIGAWNMLRVLSEPTRVRIWLNPNFADIMGGSVPAEERKTPQSPTPLVDVAADTAAVGLSAVAAGGSWRIDYASVLPPTLFVDSDESLFV